jgi:hypothetical protein
MYKGISTRIGFPRISDRLGIVKVRLIDTRIHPRISSARVFFGNGQTRGVRRYDYQFLSQTFIVGPLSSGEQRTGVESKRNKSYDMTAVIKVTDASIKGPGVCRMAVMHIKLRTKSWRIQQASDSFFVKANALASLV